MHIIKLLQQYLRWWLSDNHVNSTTCITGVCWEMNGQGVPWQSVSHDLIDHQNMSHTCIRRKKVFLVLNEWMRMQQREKCTRKRLHCFSLHWFSSSLLQWKRLQEMGQALHLYFSCKSFALTFSGPLILAFSWLRRIASTIWPIIWNKSNLCKKSELS